jgi:hypothetical protein
MRNIDMRLIQSRYTPEPITTLGDNERFVFGANIDGTHSYGHAYIACNKFGAIRGQGSGFQGYSYGIIITNEHGKPMPFRYLSLQFNTFIAHALDYPHLKFLVVNICNGSGGLALHTVCTLLLKAYTIPNIYLPKNFFKEMHAIIMTQDV